jgi:RNA polymerase sigma-32 factor
MNINAGSIEQYIQSVNAMPMLSLEEEQKLTRAWHIEKDTNAAKMLVMSHLRVVVSIARQYFGYGIAHADLIQEGNIGLMKAVRKFDPSFNVRLVTYATHWIKAEIHDYILKNWRMVKIATTKAQRKLFFKLRSLLPKDSSLSLEHIDKIAKQLDVKNHEVIEMQSRLVQSDASLDEQYNEDSETSLVNTLSDERYEPYQALVTQQKAQQYEKIHSIIENLKSKDERMHDIIQQRWLNPNEEKTPFKEFASKWKISIERVSQLEKMAIKYIKEQVSKIHN